MSADEANREDLGSAAGVRRPELSPPRRTSMTLTRGIKESIEIGPDVLITVVEVKGKRVRINVNSPATHVIKRTNNHQPATAAQ